MLFYVAGLTMIQGIIKYRSIADETIQLPDVAPPFLDRICISRDRYRRKAIGSINVLQKLADDFDGWLLNLGVLPTADTRSTSRGNPAGISMNADVNADVDDDDESIICGLCYDLGCDVEDMEFFDCGEPLSEEDW